MKMKLVILLGAIAAAFIACNNDPASADSGNVGANSSASGSGVSTLPDTVATLDELLQKYTCVPAYQCAHVYVTEWKNVMECNDKAWSYLSEYTPSVCGYGSSSSAADFSSSSTAEEVSSSSEEISSSSETSVNQSSSSVTETASSSSVAADQCAAMDEKDITTWHFVKETFAGPVTYTYSINAEEKIILTTKESDGTEKISYTYSGSSDVYMMMAYNAALTTCKGE